MDETALREIAKTARQDIDRWIAPLMVPAITSPYAGLCDLSASMLYERLAGVDVEVRVVKGQLNLRGRNAVPSVFVPLGGPIQDEPHWWLEAACFLIDIAADQFNSLLPQSRHFAEVEVGDRSRYSDSHIAGQACVPKVAAGGWEATIRAAFAREHALAIASSS